MSNGLFRGGNRSLRDLNRFDQDSSPAKVNNSIFNREHSSQPSVMLYIFSPCTREDPIIRPHSYNLDPETMNTIQETVATVRQDTLRSISGATRDRFYMHNNPTIDQALLPGNQSFRFGRNYLNDLPSFVLMVNNAPIHSRVAINSNLKNSLIYTGYFLDEPLSRRGGYLNLDCEMVFTHMTQIDVDQVAEKSGFNAIARPRLDVDILSPKIVDLDSSHDDERKYLLSPVEVVGAIVDDSSPDRPFEITDQEVATLDHKDLAATEISVYNSPRQQMNRVISSLAKTVVEFDASQTSPLVGNGRVASIFSDRFGIKKTFQNFLGGTYSDRLVGPDYRKVITLGALSRLYPNVEDNLTYIELPDDMSMDVIDEENTDLLTIMSCFLKHSVPAVFADHGISQIAFRYATSDPRDNFITRREREPVWEILECQPFMAEPIEHTRERVELMFRHLREYVFSVVENICDDIEVLIQHRSCGDTVVQLQLRDHTEEINDGFSVLQGSLGGIVSPNLGGSDNFENHNNTLTSMLDLVDATMSSSLDDRFY